MKRNVLFNLLESVGISVDKVMRAGDHAPLVNQGMDSLTIVQVVLALEASIGVRIPDELMEKRHFETVSALEGLIRQLEDRKKSQTTKDSEVV